MPPKTVRRALIDTLEDLSDAQLKEFCSTVWHRDEEPKVKRSALENKGCPEIVDALFSVYTESRAADVALETLREIGCNNLRVRLEKAISETSQTYVTIHGDIMMVETSGASMETAQQDRLKYSGVEASHTMAETDLEEMNNYKSIIKNVARQKRVDPALIAAIISRSCRAGKTLVEGKGCYNQERGDYTFGLMQLYVNPNGGGHEPKGSWDSEEHLCQGTDILIKCMSNIRRNFRDWTKEQQLKGGIAAYYAGDGNINSYEDVDKHTDYSNDVVARAQWYKSNGGF